MSLAIGVLGPGAVGGSLAVRLAAGGADVVCVGRPVTVRRIAEQGLELDEGNGSVHASPRAVERLDEPVDLLVVSVKAPALVDALTRVSPTAVTSGVVVPLLNGLEHPTTIRAALGRCVAPGSISRFEAYVETAGRIVQRSGPGVVTVAPGDVTRAALDDALAPLVRVGVDVRVRDDERAVLWEKAARLGVLAAATSASELTVGALREDPTWRRRLDAALGEACRVAAAEGVEVTPTSQWAIIDGMPPSLTTSTARDIAAGRLSELDAIAGSVVRAAARAGLACPELGALVAEAQERAA